MWPPLHAQTPTGDVAAVFGNEMDRLNLGTYRSSFSKLAWEEQGTVHTYAGGLEGAGKHERRS